MGRVSTGLDGKLDRELASAVRHTLISEPVNGGRGYVRMEDFPFAESGADTVRLAIFFSGSGGGWLLRLLTEGGLGEPGADATGLRGNGEHGIRVASREPEKAGKITSEGLSVSYSKLKYGETQTHK